MIRRLDADGLENCCQAAPTDISPAQAARAVEALGWLAPWWLEAEVLRRASQYQPAYRRWTSRPPLPSDPGGCWIIFIRRPDCVSLRAAYLLPLRWRKDAEDDPHLPPPLRGEADRVRGQAAAKDGGRWGLWLARPDGEEALDLSALDGAAMGVESGWASLLGGLRLAQDDGTPDAAVWASAAWHDEFGIGEVRGLAEKLALAEEYHAGKVFVPVQNRRDVDEWRKAGGKTAVEFLAPVSKQPDPGRLLEPYLDVLETAPDCGAPFERRRRFYARVNRGRAAEYYWTHLLDDVVARCREQLRADHPDCRPTHLVTVVSNERSVVVQAPAALQVRRCLLLYEKPSCDGGRPDQPGGKIQRNRDEIHERLKGRGVEVDAAGVRLGDRPEELRQRRFEVRRFAEGVPPGELAFDLTPGYKLLSLEMEELAPAGSWLLYCRHRQLGPDNRVDPGTERYDCWHRS